MLITKKGTVLRYSAGYGQNKPEKEILQATQFHLNNPKSKGIFVLAVKEKRPFLINDIDEIKDSFSIRSIEIADKLGGKSLICVPIIYERQPLGILAVDNIKSSRP